jgi:putative transposase
MSNNAIIYYHLILTIKYRKKIINNYIYTIKSSIKSIKNKNFNILEMESDLDHIHLLIQSNPQISPSQIIKIIKQKTTFDLWMKYPDQLKKEFWKKHIFWNRSYYIASVGDLSKEVIKNYILNQGK